MKQFIFAPNYLKYKGSRVHERNMPMHDSCSPPYLSFPEDKERLHRTAQPSPSQGQDPGATKPPEDSASGGQRVSLRSKEEPSDKNVKTRFAATSKTNGTTVPSLQSQIQAKEAEDAYRLDRFEKIWAKWPKRTKYLEAKLVWLTIKPDDQTAKLIFEHAEERQQRDEEWQRDNGQYIPNLAKFLEDERWTDVMPRKVLPL